MAKVLTAGPANGPDRGFAPVDYYPARRWYVLRTIEVWWQRQRERARLAQLDDRMLKDIGLVRGDIDTEINKGFWQP